MRDKNGQMISGGDLALIDTEGLEYGTEGIVQGIKEDLVVVRDSEDRFFTVDPSRIAIRGKRLSIGGVTIPFSSQTPTEEGKYLWQHSMGVEVITVRTRLPETYGGIELNSYLAVVEFRGRAVAALKGKFAKSEGV